jgi:phosphoribosylaminoimidazole-succinocarboxamide synthase
LFFVSSIQEPAAAWPRQGARHLRRRRRQLLIVTSDRLSAFDVILPDPIPDKGKVLTQVANFWFDKLGHIVPNQLTGIDPETVVARKSATRCAAAPWSSSA